MLCSLPASPPTAVLCPTLPPCSWGRRVSGLLVAESL